MTNDNYSEFVVMGAGIGGLVTACLLAKNGKEVVVLERNSYAGGSCVNFSRGGYTFESAIHAINGCNKNGRTMNILNECGIGNQINFLQPKKMCRIITPSNDISIPEAQGFEAMNILKKNFPDQAPAIESFFSKLESLFGSNDHDFRTKKSLLNSELWALRNVSLQQLLDNYFKDQSLKCALSQYWGYMGAPPSSLSATSYLYMFWDYMINGSYYPEGGSGIIAKKLVNEIQLNGGRVCLDSEISSLGTHGNKLVSATTVNGKKYHGKKFICNMSTKKIFCNLLKKKNSDQKKVEIVMDKMKLSPSAFIVYLGLNTKISKYFEDDYEIFINPSNDVERQISGIENCSPKNSQIGITIYSNLDKTVCADGKSVMSVFMLSDYNFWKKESVKNYVDLKNNIANELLSCCKQVIPDVKSSAEVIEVATPLTVEKYTGANNGALYGWNPKATTTLEESKIKKKPLFNNMYVSGAWTAPGGGLSSVVYSGHRVAKHLLVGSCENQ